MHKMSARLKGMWLAVLALTVATCSSVFAQTASPTFDAAATVTTGKDAIITLITSVAPVVFAALAVVIGWRFAVKLFKRLGKSI